MGEQQDCVETYNAALRAERELWAEMQGRYPGQPGFNKSVWDQWLTAISRCTAASRLMRQAQAGPSKDAPSKWENKAPHRRTDLE